MLADSFFEEERFSMTIKRELVFFLFSKLFDENIAILTQQKLLDALDLTQILQPIPCAIFLNVRY